MDVCSGKARVVGRSSCIVFIWSWEGCSHWHSVNHRWCSVLLRGCQFGCFWCHCVCVCVCVCVWLLQYYCTFCCLSRKCFILKPHVWLYNSTTQMKSTPPSWSSPSSWVTLQLNEGLLPLFNAVLFRYDYVLWCFVAPICIIFLF